VSGPYHEHSHSPLRRRPGAATWPSARDVSSRAEPDVRPLGRAAPHLSRIRRAALAFNVPCLLCLAGDVPPQHLMHPVYSADGRWPGHPAGGVPVRSGGRQYARTTTYNVLIITRTLPVKLPLHADTTQAADTRAQGDCTGDQH
jgi:hypothetical protein